MFLCEFHSYLCFDIVLPLYLCERKSEDILYSFIKLFTKHFFFWMCVLWQSWSTHRIFFYWIPAHINIWVEKDCLFKKGEGDVLIVYLTFIQWGCCSYSHWWNETSTSLMLGNSFMNIFIGSNVATNFRISYIIH